MIKCTTQRFHRSRGVFGSRSRLGNRHSIGSYPFGTSSSNDYDDEEYYYRPTFFRSNAEHSTESSKDHQEEVTRTDQLVPLSEEESEELSTLENV